jgi:hypothetical protein
MATYGHGKNVNLPVYQNQPPMSRGKSGGNKKRKCTGGLASGNG